MKAELVLSTVGHEIGHAVFDVPGWIVTSKYGDDQFGPTKTQQRRAFRAVTRSLHHLYRTGTGDGSESRTMTNPGGQCCYPTQDVMFAELRANEFMGSLLVPRAHLTKAVCELAPDLGVQVVSTPGLFAGETAMVHLETQGSFGFVNLENLQRALAPRFGVNPQFIKVRMQKYGLLPDARSGSA